jgi:hypothetical protein
MEAPEVDGSFPFCVDRCRRRLAAHHPGAVQEFFSVLRLGQEEPSVGVLHVHAEEVVEGPHVLDGELGL